MRPTLKFVPTLVAAAGLALGPATLRAQTEAPAARVMAADEGDVGTGPNGATIHFKVGSQSTGATQLFLATGTMPPGVETGVHLHEVDEEVLYVLEGQVEVTLDGTLHTVSAGGTAFIPPGTWMQVANRASTPARILGILSRAEVEKCFRAIYAPPGRDEAGRAANLATCRIKSAEARQQQ